LGVQFDRLPKFSNAHLGAFWKTLPEQDWPIVADAPALPQQHEQFTALARWGQGLRLQLTQDPACRLQIKNAVGDRMLQVQNGRLHFNWLGEHGKPYPRYEVVRQEFESALSNLVRYIAENGLGDIRPNQWEVTYINLIPKGTVWNSPRDWRFFKLHGFPANLDDTVKCEGFTGEWHFEIPEQRGRLHIEWQHGVKPLKEDQDEEIVRLTFTARGGIDPKKTPWKDEVLQGLDLGREAIVRTFAALMSVKANQYWGLTNAAS
jgi:uncharacterized protein (TIGR04255 family)